MSSGSYFTIYAKHKKQKVSEEVLNALKNEYYLSNKKNIYKEISSEEDERLKKDLPIFMHAAFNSDFSKMTSEDESSDIYYAQDASICNKLLEFHFCSSFVCLKEHFSLNAYKYSESSTIISKSLAKEMLQAIEYVLSEKYDKTFENVLNNDFIEVFGNGYSLFDNRFHQEHKPIYIDKEFKDGYVIRFDDYGYEKEIIENDNGIRHDLNKAKACLLAYLNAEDNSWEDNELILEYSAY